LQDSITLDRASGLSVVAGLPNASGWSQVRPGEIVRVVERLAAGESYVVVDTAGALDDVESAPRGRNSVARALIVEADIVVGVCAASPVGVARFLSWAVEAKRLAPFTPMVVAVNRASDARFQRGELYDELTRSLSVVDVLFTADDCRVSQAMWDGRMVARGPFTRAVDRLGAIVRSARGTPECTDAESAIEIAS
jgi:hypothetical protein